MATFLESPRFPDDISFGSVGGPGYFTQIAEALSAIEQRNIGWKYPRHKYNAALGVRTRSQLDTLIAYFHAVAGRAVGFRWKDWLDYKSCGSADTYTDVDQAIGVGDGSTTAFQLYKTYTQGARSLSRKITKPVSGTIIVAIDSVRKTETTHYTIDYATGIITLASPLATDAVLSWGGEFDVPVRFGIDELEITLDTPAIGHLDIPIIEIRV